MSSNKLIKKHAVLAIILATIFINTKVVRAKEEDTLSFEEKQRLQVAEVYTGKILSIQPLEDNPEETGKDYFFELRIMEIHKTKTAPRIGDTVKVKFIKGAVIITGNKPMMALEGDIVKIYADNSRTDKGFLELKYGGDSVYIIQGEEPTDMETFLALFGIERSNIYAGEIVMVVGVLLLALMLSTFIIKTFKIKRT